MSNGIGHVWAVNAEGGDEGRPNGVGPVWIENADQLGSKLPEPEAGDTGKVLGVLNADGDIGWVPDQEGMAQVQADWEQTDSSQVSYIANKPSLATVATTGAYSDLSGTPTIPTVDQEYNAASANAQSGVAVAGAISGKQDTINDLETIRSGAAAGATAVQPATLNDYATTSALTSGLSTKQDTISDLETIRSGASAGATAVQPSSLATVATTGSYTDLLDKPSIPAAQVNSDWNAASGVSQILNKPSLATVATTGSYADLSNKPTIPTVDQTYNAASTNAQSGTAVAQAIAAIPSASYTAGDGVNITAGEISVKAGTGLEISDVSSSVTENLSCSEFSTDSEGTWVRCVAPLTQDILNAINTSDGFSFTTSRDFAAWGVDVYVGLYRYGSDSFDAISHVLFGTALTPVSDQIPSGTTFTLKASEVDATYSTATLSYVAENLSQYRIGILNHAQSTPWSHLFIGVSEVTETPTPSSVVTATYSTTTTIQDALCVSNPLPASAVGDVDKVLTVNSSGNPVWAAAQGGSSYTAGDGIDITSDTISADLDPKGLKITSGKIDINLANNSGLDYAQSSVTESLTVGGNTYYNGSIRLIQSDLEAYLANASDGDTFTLTIPSGTFVLNRPLNPGEPICFALSSNVAFEHSSLYWYIDVTNQVTVTTGDNDTTVLGACTITLPAYLRASAGWSADVLQWSYGFFTPDPSYPYDTFDGSGTVTASYPGSLSGLKVSNPIQLVAALPANPDANTLYLIPEA